jgi:hypothetical protein
MKVISYLLIAAGSAALLASILYDLSALTFIGLGVFAWGIILAYIRTDDYTKKVLLDAVAHPQLKNIDQIVNELEYKGHTIYLPPKYLTNQELNKAYISKRNETSLPTPAQIKEQEDRFFVENPSGILMTPPGDGLATLFEKTLKANFGKKDMQYVEMKMPNLLVEDLEIARKVEFETKKNRIRVKIENSSPTTLKIKGDESSKPYSTFDSLLASAIACVLARATGKPIMLEKQQNELFSARTETRRELTLEYRVLDELE